jgi:ABC-2 type transport system permease protein
MRRYFRLYLHFLQFSFSKAMEFRLDFFFKIFMDVAYYSVNILFFKVIFLHTSFLGGWSQEQMMIFVSTYILIDAISMTVFSTNMWWLPYHINRGDLDYHLIRPVSPLFFLSLKEFSANSFVNLLMALAIFIYTILNYPHSYEAFDLILLTGLILNGALLYYCCQMLMILPVFWTQSARGFMDLFYSIGIAMERPDKIFTGWRRFIFTFIIPFSLIASFPAKLFIEKFNWPTFLHLIGVSALFWMIMLSIWKKGLKTYSSASS